jgi:hypothetical protein
LLIQDGTMRTGRWSFFGSPAEDDVRHRSDELVDVVPKARDRYGLAAPVALDYAW